MKNAGRDRDYAVHTPPRLGGIDSDAGPGRRQRGRQSFDGQQSESAAGRAAELGCRRRRGVHGAAVSRRTAGQDHRRSVSGHPHALHGSRTHRRRRKHLHFVAGNSHAVRIIIITRCQGVQLPVPAAVRGTTERECGLISKHVHHQLIARCSPLFHFLNVLLPIGFVLVGQNNNNNNNHEDTYSAVIMTEVMREFTRFIW